MTETKVERYIRFLTNAVEFVEAQNKEEGKDYFVQISPAATREIIEILKNSLKEQDEGIAPIESTTEQKKFADRIGFAVSEYWCGDCHFNLFNRPKFCPNCGKKVKWDD